MFFCFASFTYIPLAGNLKRINRARDANGMDSAPAGCTLFFSREKKPALKKRVARGREEVSRRAAGAAQLKPSLPRNLPLPPNAGKFSLSCSHFRAVPFDMIVRRRKVQATDKTVGI